MCGIAGLLEATAAKSNAELGAIASSMGLAIEHRGPDASGVWVDERCGVALAHRRLSIVDLSSAGNQPMASSCGRYILVYNGEIYNTDELRAELRDSAGTVFHGRSDTEVIVEGFSVWGVRDTVTRLNGMFAFAVWDRTQDQLSLVRDRLGIKPLYWSRQNSSLIFGSELKALHAHPQWQAREDRDALAAFLRHNCIPAPHTVYRDVHKLEPGVILTQDAGLHSAPRIEHYWSLEDVVKDGQRNPLRASDAETVNQLEALLTDAVGRQAIADVPLGAFLSGGIDSSVVVALMQKNAGRPVKTFSIGFSEDGYEEAQHAARVARHLGTEHTELYVSPEQAQRVIPMLTDMFDEPFADSSQIPTYLVSAMTREHVKVALSGDGGDELFAGYNRYLQSRRIGQFPLWLRRAGAHFIQAFSPTFWDRLLGLAPRSRRLPQAGEKMHKLAAVLGENDDGYYRRLVSHWQHPEDIITASREPKGLIWTPQGKDIAPGRVDRMRYFDTRTYLPDDILTKVDRASMAVSLETRVPLLDHRVVEFAWRLPESALIRNGQGKWPLRQVLYKYVPRELIDRPKMGFAVPIGAWLRGPLKEWAEHLLNPAMIEKHGILSPRPIWQKWQEHLSGDCDWQYHLWDVLMLQAWCERYARAPAARPII